ncbi:hypothetical protein roselon_02131 [Roseibacterium elongatum DSM 19469]|uniref:Uncharacterized protein n=1 Tax=Roseicyclus elongatus DSM 19469 TaxID=1294273 RepID=W8S6J3_9RHOB|nr:hypothetical protein [Roseibacterium elongatum]AHM04476.1 hypothetical protein roselon_02131 [Roseibacterium elongatum DSM 19469]
MTFLGRVARLALSILPVASVASAGQPVMPSDWDIAQRTDSVAAYSRFILEHPDSPHVEEAQSRIEALGQLEASITARVAPAVDAGLQSAGSNARLMNI